MKLGWRDVESFVKKPDARARVVLVYGPDDGLMRERAKTISQSIVPDINDPFNVTTLGSDDISADPAKLFDEAQSMSLMGGARLIRIEDGADKITPVLKDYLKDPSAENLVVIEAGELGPRSTLRTLVEKAANAAAVPCYVEDARGVTNLIRSMAQEAGYTVQSDAIQFLAANLAGDRLRIRSEMEKLFTYAGSVKNITLEDARAACGIAGDQSVDDLIYAIGAGHVETSMATYNKLLGEGVAVVSILRAMQNHFRRLHFIKTAVAGGAGIEEAMKSLQPPIFFKLEDAFKSHVRKYSDTRLMAIMTRLSQIEAQTKTTGAPVETLCSQAILSLASQH